MNTMFPIIAMIAATFGWIVGYFLRGRLRPTVLVCTITPILAQVVILSLLPHEGASSDAKSQELRLLYYGIVPFLLLTVPCLITGLLTALVVYHTESKA